MVWCNENEKWVLISLFISCTWHSTKENSVGINWSNSSLPHLLLHSHRGPQHLLHHQHVFHLLGGRDRSSRTKRLPLVPAVFIPGPEAFWTDCAPCGGAGLQGPCPHRGCALHRKAPQWHPQPVQAATTPQGQELWWSVPGKRFSKIVTALTKVILQVLNQVPNS